MNGWQQGDHVADTTRLDEAVNIPLDGTGLLQEEHDLNLGWSVCPTGLIDWRGKRSGQQNRTFAPTQLRGGESVGCHQTQWMRGEVDTEETETKLGKGLTQVTDEGVLSNRVLVKRIDVYHGSQAQFLDLWSWVEEQMVMKLIQEIHRVVHLFIHDTER